MFKSNKYSVRRICFVVSFYHNNISLNSITHTHMCLCWCCECFVCVDMPSTKIMVAFHMNCLLKKHSIRCWCRTFCFRSTNNKWLRHPRNKRDTLVDVVAATAVRMNKNSFLFHWSDRFHANQICWIQAFPRAFGVCFTFCLWTDELPNLTVCAEHSTHVMHHLHTCARQIHLQVIESHHNLSIDWIQWAMKSRQNKNVSMIKCGLFILVFDLTLTHTQPKCN